MSRGAARVRLDTVAEILPGYAQRNPASQPSSSPWRIVLGRHAIESGEIAWADLLPCEPARAIERLALKSGDVLLTTRTTLMRAIPLHDVPPHVIASAQFARLRPKLDRTDPDYLAWTLNREETLSRLRALSKGSSIPFLSVAEIEAFEIPLPPLEQQRAIARVLEIRRRELELRERLAHALDVLIDAASRLDMNRR